MGWGIKLCKPTPNGKGVYEVLDTLYFSFNWHDLGRYWNVGEHMKDKTIEEAATLLKTADELLESDKVEVGKPDAKNPDWSYGNSANEQVRLCTFRYHIQRFIKQLDKLPKDALCLSEGDDYRFSDSLCMSDDEQDVTNNKDEDESKMDKSTSTDIPTFPGLYYLMVNGKPTAPTIHYARGHISVSTVEDAWSVAASLLEQGDSRYQSWLDFGKWLATLN